MLLAVLVAANLLSLLDGVLTALEIQAGVATEGNPVLAPLYATSPYLAVAFKVVVVALISLGIWHQRRYRYVLAVSLVALAVFTGLVAYHLGNLQGLGYL